MLEYQPTTLVVQFEWNTPSSHFGALVYTECLLLEVGQPSQSYTVRTWRPVAFATTVWPPPGRPGGQIIC